MVKERGYECHLTCSKETKKLIIEDCKKEFLKHHPEFKGMSISCGFLLKKIGVYYIENE